MVQHSCVLPLNNPQGTRIGMTKMDGEMYKAHRDTCRADFAEFDDAAYRLQEEYLKKT